MPEPVSVPIVLDVEETSYEMDAGSEVVVNQLSGRGIPSGGASGQVLTKQSADDYDVEWEDPVAVHSAVVVVASMSGMTITADHTYAELAAAAAADKPIVLMLNSEVCTTYRVTQNKITFAIKPQQVIVAGSGVTNLVSNRVEVSADGWEYWVSQSQLIPSDIGAGTYSKPSSGIPKNDLASAVKTSLGKADNAIPAPASASAGDVLTYSNGAWAAVAPSGGTSNTFIIEWNELTSTFEHFDNIVAAREAGKTLVLHLTTGAGNNAPLDDEFWLSDYVYLQTETEISGQPNDVTKEFYFDVPLGRSGGIPTEYAIIGHYSNNTLIVAEYEPFVYSGVIPKTALASAVQTSLGKADTAIQAPSSPSVGDFLVYTSNGWAAQSLSTWSGGNY